MAAVFLSFCRFGRHIFVNNSSIIKRKAILLLRLTSTRAVAWKPLGILSKRDGQWRLLFGVGGCCLSAGVALCYATNVIQKLCRSTKDNNVLELERLLKQGHDVNQKHSLGWAPIHVAAINGSDRALQLLLEAGADPNTLEEFSSAFKVAQKKQRGTYEVILERENTFSERLNKGANFSGFTPLHYAALADSYECVQLLLNAGADPTIKDDTGHNAISYTREQSIINIINEYTTKFVEEKKRKEAEERRRYPLEKRIKEHIVGQEGPILTVAGAIRRKENGWHDAEHPLTFLFLGSSGIGKTELAKQIANYIHKGNKKGFIRLDMSEYQEKHEVAKMIGSPPGYIGHDQGGQLTKRLQECPDAVVLFDEVDKAHPDVLTVMLQLFDEGRLTDGKGKTIDCKDAIFVMTSNLASNEIANHALELRQEAHEAALMRKDKNEITEQVTISRKFKEKVVQPILKRHFQRDEFLGRINEIVYFLPFSRTELLQLVSRELEHWCKTALKRHDIHITWDREVMDVLADGYDVYYGARSIKHEVERRVVDQLAAAHERELIEHGSTIHITVDYSLQHENHRKPSKEQRDVSVTPMIKLQLVKEGSKKVDIDIKSDLNHEDYKLIF
uniref:Caseinolytic peptidase B protein homolog n=1 Tax=Actinia tenebrosa TaxID=6105 RepID=A0A6P8IHM2_ACTTE